MQTLLVFIAVAALSVLASNQRLLQAGRFFNLAHLSASGLLFLVLGAVLGPGGAHLIHLEQLEAARPLLALGLGLGGLLIGLNLEPQLLRGLPRAVFGAATAHSGLAFVTVAVPAAALLIGVMDLSIKTVIGGAVLLGGAASISSSHMAVLWHRGGRLDRLRGLSISLLAMLDDLVGIAILALALTLGAHESLHVGLSLVALAALLGILCGALTAYLIHESGRGAELTAILLGAVGLVSGAAAYLRISALIAGLACGATLALIGGRQVAAAYRAIARTERPVYLLLLFFVGAHFQFVQGPAFLLLLPAFLVLRLAGKIWGGQLAAKVASGTLRLPPQPGFALLGQGGLSLCLLVEYLILVPGELSQLVFNVGICAAVVNEVIALRAFPLSLGTASPGAAAPAAPGSTSIEGGGA